MKRRTGFVSNSSSSSFICDVCGEEVSGMDLSMEDACMYNCENGHIICGDHIIGDIESLTIEEKKKIYLSQGWDDDKKKAIAIMSNEDFEEEWEEEESYMTREALPARFCPCCQFESVSNGDMISYILKKEGMDGKAFAKKLKDEFGTYSPFKEFIGKGKKDD